MPLLLSRRVAFIHIPKTGGTTLEQILIDAFPEDFCFINTHRGFGPLRYNADSPAMREMARRASVANSPQFPSFQHWTYAQIKTLVPDLDEWWSFAFVRSPWARLYSEYRYWTRFLKRGQLPFSEWAVRALDRVRRNPALLDNHLRPQWQFLGPKTEVFRFERLGDEIRKVAAKLAIPAYELKEHFRSGEQEEFRSAYTDRLIELVADYYGEDVSRFNYRYG